MFNIYLARNKRSLEQLIKRCSILFIVLCLVGCYPSYAQRYDQVIMPSYQTSGFTSLFTVDDTITGDDFIQAYYQSIIDREKLWTGLKLDGFYRYNSKNYGYDDEFLSYRQQLSVGLEWDLIHGGYSTRKLKIAQAELDRDEYLFNASQAFFTTKIKVKQLYVEQSFWHEMAYWKYLEVKAYKDILRIDSLAFIGGSITDLEYKLSQEQLKRLEIELDRFGYQSDSIAAFSNFLPLFKVDSLFSTNDSIHVFIEKLGIIEKQKEFVYEKNKTVHDITLQPNLKYNLFDRVDEGVKGYFSLGVRFSMPLTAFYGKNSTHELALIDYEFQQENDNIKQRINGLVQQIYNSKIEIDTYQTKIALLKIENEGKQGSYYNLQKEYLQRVLLILHYQKTITEMKRDSLTQLIKVMDICGNDEVLNYVTFY